MSYARRAATNHIHTVIRNPVNDYGKAWRSPPPTMRPLREGYLSAGRRPGC